MPEIYLLIPEQDGYQKINVLFSAFPDGDIHCIVPESEQLVDKPVLVFARIYPDQHVQIFRLLLLLDLLKATGVTKISVFCPYLPYSRQDKSHITGEAVSINTICRLLANVGCECLYTLDCHFMKGRSEEVRCGLRIQNISLVQELMSACRKMLGDEPFEVIGPDKGSLYLVQSFGAQYMHKQRGNYANLIAGDSYQTVTELKDDHIVIGSKTILVLDDMISTGATLEQTVRNLRLRNVEHVYCAATHGLFLRNSYKTLTELTDGIVFSDSIENPQAVTMVQKVLREKIVPMWLQSVE